MQIAYLNGVYMPLQECRISVLDRGFIFGDGIYEMIPIYDGIPFRGSAHLQRMSRNCRETGIINPHTDAEWEQIINIMIQKSGDGNHALYLQITRGCGPRDHYVASALAPTIFGMTMPITPTPENLLAQGIAAITAEDIRWQRCDIKTTSLAANILLRKMAIEEGVQETILLRDGLVTEATAANVFLIYIHQGQPVLVTPPKDCRILPGITRDAVIELAQQHKIAMEEREIKEPELYTAKEIWLTSSTKEIIPVTQINDTVIGDGCAGNICKQFRQWLTLIRT